MLPMVDDTKLFGLFHRRNYKPFTTFFNFVSYIVGAVLFIGGVTLIAVASKLPSGDYFLIGPFCVAAGVIFLIRGCINKLAQRQQRREEVRISISLYLHEGYIMSNNTSLTRPPMILDSKHQFSPAIIVCHLSMESDW